MTAMQFSGDVVTELRTRLAEAEAALDALRRGEADAIVGQTGVVSLRGAERPYHAFFDAMHEGGLTLDPEWRVLHCNPSFAAMVASPANQLRGRSLLDWIPVADHPRLLRLCSSATAGIVETSLMGRSGVPLPVLLSMNIIELDGQSVVCVVVTDLRERDEREALLRSITAEHRISLEELVRLRTRELQTSEARTRAVLTTMLDGVVHIDAGGILLSVNHALLTMFGYEDEDDLLGHNVRVLMPAAAATAHDSHLQRYQETRQRRIVGSRREVEGRRRDGSHFPIELGVNEMVDDMGSTFIGVIRDLTEQKAASWPI